MAPRSAEAPSSVPSSPEPHWPRAPRPGVRQGRHRHPQLRAHARVPRARLLQRGDVEGQDHRPQDGGVPEGRHPRRAQARRLPQEGSRQGRRQGAEVQLPGHPPATRPSSSRPRSSLENTGVHAYLGQAGNIKTPAYLLAAASIVTIEARHAGAIASIIGKPINPSGAFDKGWTAGHVLSAVKATNSSSPERRTARGAARAWKPGRRLVPPVLPRNSGPPNPFQRAWGVMDPRLGNRDAGRRPLSSSRWPSRAGSGSQLRHRPSPGRIGTRRSPSGARFT